MSDQELLPLVVDLDGTLIHTDLLHESALRKVKSNVLSLLSFPSWLNQGKAHLKKHLSTDIDIDLASIPINEDVLQ